MKSFCQLSFFAFLISIFGLRLIASWKQMMGYIVERCNV
ncbi:hypothetical protein [uncultured Gammaproteobacteria bacterium]|nr:hypothetical protein [uncultured Gammaproteobacteria bacterium]